MRSKAYRGIGVKRVEVDRLTRHRDGQSVCVGTDVGKDWLWLQARWGNGDLERPWKVANPGEIGCGIGVLDRLGQGRDVRVGMESSGTYGEAFRHALTAAGIAVERVSGKAVHDYAEVFDGVPSQHDGKDAGVVAELMALGKSSPWPYQAPSEWDGQLSLGVDTWDAFERIRTIWTNRVEAWLARHWPEMKDFLRPKSPTLLRTVREYGGPGGVAAAAGQACEQMHRWSRGMLSPEKLDGLISSARQTVGVAPNSAEQQRVGLFAEQALGAWDQIRQAERTLRELTREHRVVQAQAAGVGVGTACVLWVDVGDPAGYGSGGAYRKAMGLNLREYSSGRHQGELKISRRGPSRARRWLYLAAVRLTRHPSVRPWYVAKRANDRGEGGRALVGIMRRLAVGLWHVGREGRAFDAALLFGAKRSESARGAEGRCE